MNLFADPPPAKDPARLELEVGRVVQRLRTISVERLEHPVGDGRTRAGAALGVAQQFADHRARLLGEEPRTLPPVASHAVADVLAVLAADLIEVLRAIAPRQDPGSPSPLRLPDPEIAESHAPTPSGDAPQRVSDAPSSEAAKLCEQAVAAAEALRRVV